MVTYTDFLFIKMPIVLPFQNSRSILHPEETQSPGGQDSHLRVLNRLLRSAPEGNCPWDAPRPTGGLRVRGLLLGVSGLGFGFCVGRPHSSKCDEVSSLELVSGTVFVMV